MEEWRGGGYTPHLLPSRPRPPAHATQTPTRCGGRKGRSGDCGCCHEGGWGAAHQRVAGRPHCHPKRARHGMHERPLGEGRRRLVAARRLPPTPKDGRGITSTTSATHPHPSGPAAQTKQTKRPVDGRAAQPLSPPTRSLEPPNRPPPHPPRPNPLLTSHHASPTAQPPPPSPPHPPPPSPPPPSAYCTNTGCSSQ